MGDTRVRMEKGDRERSERRWGLVEEPLARVSSPGSNQGEFGGGGGSFVEAQEELQESEKREREQREGIWT